MLYGYLDENYSIFYLQHVPLEVVIRFVLLIVGGSLRLYVSAKPADDLKENVWISHSH